MGTDAGMDQQGGMGQQGGMTQQGGMGGGHHHKDHHRRHEAEAAGAGLLGMRTHLRHNLSQSPDRVDIVAASIV